jgi:hypothetical protein
VVTALFLMTGEAAAVAARAALSRNWVRILERENKKSKMLEALKRSGLNCLYDFDAFSPTYLRCPGFLNTYIFPRAGHSKPLTKVLHTYRIRFETLYPSPKCPETPEWSILRAGSRKRIGLVRR